MKNKIENVSLIKHEILLVSLLLLLFGPLFIPPAFESMVRPFFFIQAFVSGIILFSNRKKWRNILIVLFVIALAVQVIGHFQDHFKGTLITNSIYIIFFFSVSFKTYHKIYKSKVVERSVIFAVFSGLILLCLIATLFFSMIETEYPGSFSNLGPPDKNYANLTYFSFITCLTIGYGDIVPLTIPAKQAVMFVALLGNFYSVFVIGIIIGKYLGQKTSPEK